MHYIIKGDPISLQRPRFGRRRVWDAQKEIKTITKIELEHQHGDQPLFSGPVKVECIFYFKIPKTRRNTLKAKDPFWYKPDIDNCIKYVLDCTKGVLTDDSIVAEIYSKKMYGDIPRTELTIIELESNGKNH